MPSTVQGRAALVAAAESEGATVVRSSRATIIILDDAPAADDLVPIADAAAEKRVSVRSLTATAKAEGWLRGRQRSYVVRRSDLERWDEARRVRPLAGPDDGGMTARIARIEKARAAKESRRSA